MCSAMMSGPSQVWGSGGNGRLRKRVISGLESLSEAGAERAVIDGAANLKQEIGPSARPAHLLRFVHPAVHQEVGRAFSDCGTDPQTASVPLGIIDQPFALAGEIAIQRVQGRPQLSRRRDGLSLSVLALEVMHHRADAIDADASVLSFAVPQAPMQTANLR